VKGAPANLTMTQRVAAPVEQVYRAWTDPEVLATWWWPPRMETSYELDLRVGGAYRYRSDVAGIGVHGRYVALDPPHRIELTCIWEDGDTDGPEERVVVELEAQDTGTLVTVHHTTEAAGADDFRLGWTDCLARSGKLLL
jgi:uncharacterized protein YndB with AHSA1/START domain